MLDGGIVELIDSIVEGSHFTLAGEHTTLAGEHTTLAREHFTLVGEQAVRARLAMCSNHTHAKYHAVCAMCAKEFLLACHV